MDKKTLLRQIRENAQRIVETCSEGIDLDLPVDVALAAELAMLTAKMRKLEAVSSHRY